MILRRIWNKLKPHTSALGYVLAILFLCFLMAMMAFGLIVAQIQRTYAVLVMFVTTFVLTIPTHWLLIRLVYKLTGKHFLEKYARDQELTALRAELAERKQEAESRRNNNFPQERGQKVSWIPVWEQRIDQPIFDSVPFESEKRVQLDSRNLLVRGAKKMYHWVVPVKITREEKPDKEERLYVAGHITGRRVFWVEADDVMVTVDNPDAFYVYGLNEHAIHAGFLDDAQTPSFQVEKYFSWTVTTASGVPSADSIKKFELIREDDISARNSRIALHWEKLVGDIKRDTAAVLADVLAATKARICATLQKWDASKKVVFVDTDEKPQIDAKMQSYFALTAEKEQTE